MNLKEQLKQLIRSNPMARVRRNRMRRDLKNTDFTLLTPNCLAGILLHDLGLRFLTPTVNLMMTQIDFLNFVLNLDGYLNEELSFFSDPDNMCPCAHIQSENLPQITIYFTHYKTVEDAKSKWIDRAKRVNRNNLFIFIEERDGLTYEDLKKLRYINARGVVAFTCNPYPDLPYCVYIDKYHAEGGVGNILAKSLLDDSREYEKFFNFVRWFNEAKGEDFNVRMFEEGKH